MNRFVKNSFSSSYKTTIGADFLTKDVEISGESTNLQIWDTAGQDRFHTLSFAFYRGADACVLVYDVTGARSFNYLDQWREEFLTQAAPANPDGFPFVVLGNKADCLERRAVPEKRVETWCRQKGGIPHFLTSAKDATNVDEAFHHVAARALERTKSECADEDFFDETYDLAAQDDVDDEGCC